MTDTPTDDAEIRRLHRRYERERAARLEAEQISEQGLRELYEVTVELDARVEERTRELESARRLAEAASTAKSTFLAHISHEVHTPLNGIMGMLELLETANREPQEREWIQSATDSVARLEHLFARLVRYVELEGADLRDGLDDIEIEEVIGGLADRWRTRCAAAGQLLSVEHGAPRDTTAGWSRLLGHAVDELIDNVVRHGDPGVVRLVSTVDSGRVRIGVIDEGPGVPPEIEAAADRVLEPVTDVTTRSRAGLSLGLPYARRIAGAHGAAVRVERNGNGTAAWLTLALDQASR